MQLRSFAPRCVALLSFVAATLLGATAHAQTFVEVDGVVSMEAEHATEIVGWSEVAGDSGVAMQDGGPRSEAWLCFDIEFCQPGDYTVWVTHRKPDDATDGSNDVFASLDGEQLWVYGLEDRSECRPEGLGTHQKSFDWQSRVKINSCTEAREIPTYVSVPTAGAHTFELVSRSPGYMIDKIALIKDGREAMPSGSGPAETLASAASCQPGNPGTGGTDAGTGGTDAAAGGSSVGVGGSDADTGGTDVGAGGAEVEPLSTDDEASSDSGCSCRATGGRQRQGGALFALLALAAGLAATRRRRPH